MDTISLRRQILSLMLQRYFFSIRLCTLRLHGSSSGELGVEPGGDRGGLSVLGEVRSVAVKSVEGMEG